MAFRGELHCRLFAGGSLQLRLFQVQQVRDLPTAMNRIMAYADMLDVMPRLFPRRLL